MPAQFLCALGDILNCYAFAGISGVVVTVIRDLNDTNEFVVDHNALGAVFAGAHRFIHINVVNQFPKQRCIARNNKVAELFEKLYEDNVEGKVTDEWFLHLSHKYEVEHMELKEKIAELRGSISDLDSMQTNKDQFIHAIRKFMEMQILTAPLLRELIDHIDVYETEGTGKNRTQRIMIHYKFVGVIEIPDAGDNYTADTRKGVAVEYVTKSA